jgi:hypothetical protein
MSLSITEFRKSLLADVAAVVAPLIEELRGASSVLPVLAGAEHKRQAAVQERLAEIECEIEQTGTRRNANARRLDSYNPPKAAEPVSNTVTFPLGKVGRV